MIELHKLNGVEFILNSSHIETIEECPDTVITLTNDRKYLVRERSSDIIEKIIEYEQKAHMMYKK
jgi:flagellar protein FlbD